MSLPTVCRWVEDYGDRAVEELTLYYSYLAQAVSLFIVLSSIYIVGKLFVTPATAMGGETGFEPATLGSPQSWVLKSATFTATPSRPPLCGYRTFRTTSRDFLHER